MYRIFDKKSGLVLFRTSSVLNAIDKHKENTLEWSIASPSENITKIYPPISERVVYYAIS